MSKILKNNTASAVLIDDVGQTVPASGQLTINPQDDLLFAASSDVITLIGDSTLTVNDGANDLSISDGTDLIKGAFPSKIQITDGADEATVTNSRLDVNVLGNLSPFPSSRVAYKVTPIQESGGSSDMDVDGDPTPVEFTAGPGAGETWYVVHLGLIFEDSGSLDPEDFGNISDGLTNGVKIDFILDSTTYQLINIKNNTEIGVHFTEGGNFAPTSGGFLQDKDVFIGILPFKVPIELRGDDSDEIKVTIRDDITGVDILHMGILSFEEI